jgi:hypothetical protein
MSRAALLTAVVCLTLPSNCLAGKVKVWNHNSPGQYEKAKLNDAVVSSAGALRLSRRLRPLAALDVAHVWDVVEDQTGTLWVATGDEGKIFKVSPDGKVALTFTSEDSQVFCLALAPDGSIYAGTGPKGLLVRIPPRGKPEVIAKNLGAYVWCLAVDPAGESIFAGTGPRGRIYQVSLDGKSRVFYKAKQEHILCLGLGAEGMVYAGTDKAGLVYRIDPKGKGFVLDGRRRLCRHQRPYQAPRRDRRYHERKRFRGSLVRAIRPQGIDEQADQGRRGKEGVVKPIVPCRDRRRRETQRCVGDRGGRLR